MQTHNLFYVFDTEIYTCFHHSLLLDDGTKV